MADVTLKAGPFELKHFLDGVFLVAGREIRDMFRDWRVIFPILGLTIFFPALMNFTAQQVVDFVNQYGAPIIAMRLIPFLLMIVGFFPISISLVIALESFVGERERMSIEPLLCSPLANNQLYAGKLLASLVPPLLASYLGIAVYCIGVYTKVGWKATPALLFQIVVLTTIQAFVMVSGAVVISSQTTSVRAANLLASFVIIPMALLIQGESAVLFWGRYSTLWWIMAGEVVVASLLIRSGLTHFNREELLGRELDTLNVKWIGRTFWKSFCGEARSLLTWYRFEIPATLRRLRVPTLLIAGLIAAAIYVGGTQATVFPLPQTALDWHRLSSGSFADFQLAHFFNAGSVRLVWMQNVRAILLASLGGIFTFGVLGMLVLMLPFSIIGYFMASFSSAGLSPLTFLTALVLPHAIFEVPAILLVGGAILRLGATLAAPAQEKTIGENWLHALADWARITVGLVIPLLLLAATVEVLITPRIAILVLSAG